MIRKLNAVYENGTFRPLEPIDLRESECVTLSLDDANAASVGECDVPAIVQTMPQPESSSPETRSWRGVFPTNSPKVPIVTFEIDIRTSDLPSWEPQILVNLRWIENDAE